MVFDISDKHLTYSSESVFEMVIYIYIYIYIYILYILYIYIYIYIYIYMSVCVRVCVFSRSSVNHTQNRLWILLCATIDVAKLFWLDLVKTSKFR